MPSSLTCEKHTGESHEKLNHAESSDVFSPRWFLFISLHLVHYLQCTDHLRIGWQLMQCALHMHRNINKVIAMHAEVAKGARDSSLL